MYHTLDMKAMPIPILQIAKVFTLSPRGFKRGSQKVQLRQESVATLYNIYYIDQFLISLQK